MNAEQMVTLAKRASRIVLLGEEWSPDGLLYVLSSERWVFQPAGEPAPKNAVLSAPLNAENTRSPYALARALLRSAIKTGSRNGFAVAVCGRPQDGAKRFADTESEAVEALLDALLPAEATA